jgi:hypothetical protein
VLEKNPELLVDRTTLQIPNRHDRIDGRSFSKLSLELDPAAFSHLRPAAPAPPIAAGTAGQPFIEYATLEEKA